MRMWLRARVVAVVAAAGCLAGGAVAGVAGLPAVPAAAQSEPAGSGVGAVYVPVGPVRVLDTRNGTGAPQAPVGPGGTLVLQVTGNNGVPSSGVTAVVLNVTVTDPTDSSFVTVYPDGTSLPNASNLNFTAGETIANLVTVPVGTDGAVDFHNHAGSTDLVADLEGYYTATGTGSLLASIGPVRVLDTRNGTGAPQAPVGPGGTLSLQVEGVDGVPPTGVTAVVLNVTVTDPTESSFVTVYPDGQALPNASNVNFTAGETIPNLVVVPVGSDGAVDFHNHAGSTDLVADLEGYYGPAGAAYTPDGPARVLDTRNGTGGYFSPVGPGGTLSLQVDGVDGVPASGVTAVVLNVTATDTTDSSFVTVYPDGRALPNASNLNFTAGETIPNLVVVPVGPDGAVDFYNHTGSTDLVADLEGYYTAGGTPWADATEVPGTGALNTGGVADVVSVSCPSAGNCTAGGDYAVNSVNDEVFVADEVNGAWGDAIETPGTAALDTGGKANLGSVSCGSAGNCAAVGQYYGSSGYQAFVADEVNGTWDNAIEVPGTAALNANLAADGESVSCPSAGNCALDGYYADSSGYQAFVADEVNGTWNDAIQVPDTGTLNAGGAAIATTISCASAGNCAVGGSYTDSSGHRQAFIADEVNGTWGNAIEVPGTAALNTDNAYVNSVSCPSAGNCTAGGSYSDSSGNTQAFVADEVNGTWGSAIEVPGTAALNTSGDAWVATVSCASAGNCAAGGTFAGGSPSAYGGFVVSEVNGTWGNAIEVPGTVGPGQVISVSCWSPGNCAAGGDSAASFPIGAGSEAFVVSEVNGTWGEAIDVSSAALDGDGGEIFAVSCPSSGGCAAGGFYYPYGSGTPQTLVVSQN